MGKCIRCEKDTQRDAIVYMAQKENADYQPHREYLCISCLNEYLRRDYTGIGFYLFFQLAWFKVARDGLHGFASYFAAIFASFALIRLILILTGKIILKLSPEKKLSPIFRTGEKLDQAASEIVKEELVDVYQVKEKVLTVKEYEENKKRSRV